MLAQWITQKCRPEQIIRVPLRLGEFPFYRNLDDEQRAEWLKLSLPLPSARLKIDAADPHVPIIRAVMEQEGLKLEELKLRGLRKPFFSKGERAALCLPGNLEYQAGDDERNSGRKKL